MSRVGNIYIDATNNKKYTCTADITISPTLINDRETKYSLWKQQIGNGETIIENPKTIVLEDENGNQVVAVLVDQEVDFTATANDIREGKVAATDDGVTIGEKFIPSYHTREGRKVVMPGEEMTITALTAYDGYDYTKFQAIITPFNISVDDSTSAEFVSIEDNVYKVQTVDAVSAITKDYANRLINLNITNDFDVPCIVRYITYKEVE